MNKELKETLSSSVYIQSINFYPYILGEVRKSKNPIKFVKEIFKEMEENDFGVYVVPLSEFLVKNGIQPEACYFCDGWKLNFVNTGWGVDMTISGEKCTPRMYTKSTPSSYKCCKKFTPRKNF